MTAPEDDPRDELTEEEFWRGMEEADKVYPPDDEDEEWDDQPEF